MSPLRGPAWARAAAGMFAVGWGANQFTSLLWVTFRARTARLSRMSEASATLRG